jgi:glycosyltransferase involved in cell wall biosynthesis
VVLLEALAMGTPIVTCNIVGSGVPWVNQDGVTGFNVTPENSNDLAEKLEVLLNDQELRKRFSLNCVKRYKENFTLDKMVDATYELYKSL